MPEALSNSITSVIDALLASQVLKSILAIVGVISLVVAFAGVQTDTNSKIETNLPYSKYSQETLYLSDIKSLIIEARYDYKITYNSEDLSAKYKSMSRSEVIEDITDNFEADAIYYTDITRNIRGTITGFEIHQR